MVTLHTTFGDIKIQLNAEKAPNTVKNFLSYAENGFYEGTIFHRVIENFMVQGGAFNAEMDQKMGDDPIECESQNGLSNKTGTVAMARTMDPHSASSQFFINVKDNDFLNFSSETSQGWGYAVFGEVVEGMDVVNRMKGVKTGMAMGHQDVPVEPITIDSTEIVE